MTPTEVSTAERFIEFSRIEHHGISIARIPSAIQERRNQAAKDILYSVLSNQEIRNFLRPLLSKQLGEPFRPSTRGLLEFRREIHQWAVSTHIEVRGDAIRYTHIISGLADLGPNAGIIETSISYLGWLGLPGTEWDDVSKTDLPSIGTLLPEFIEIFLRAAPDLLAGIQNPIKIS